MKRMEGDLLKLAQDHHFDVIVHGCNCFCTMGAGIAKGVKHIFPEAYEADLNTEKGAESKLGTCSYAHIQRDGFELVVINAYTQFDYRGRGIKADYSAIRSCMRWIKANFQDKRIGLPKIGAGLAGGDWDTIESIIKEELNGADVTIVEFKP